MTQKCKISNNCKVNVILTFQDKIPHNYIFCEKNINNVLLKYSKMLVLYLLQRNHFCTFIF